MIGRGPIRRLLSAAVAMALVSWSCGASEGDATETSGRPTAETTTTTEAAAEHGGALWALMRSHGYPVEVHASVAEMAQSADLVVLGRVHDVSVGREWGDPDDIGGRVASVLVQVTVEDVVMGQLPVADDPRVTVERTLPGYSAASLGEVLTDGGIVMGPDGRPGGDGGTVAPLPGERSLWFLRLSDDVGTEIAGPPQPVVVVGASPYRLVTSLGLITETASGGARVPLSVDPPNPRFVAHVRSASFSALVLEARP